MSVATDEGIDSSARSEIAANNAAFSQAVSRGDAVAMAACYSREARLLPPGYPQVTGRDAIEAFWGAGIAAGLRSVELETLSLAVDADSAVEVGRATVVVEPEAGATSVDTGKYVVLHRRHGGRWVWEIDIFNSDAS